MGDPHAFSFHAPDLVERKGPVGPPLDVLAASITRISLLSDVTPRLLALASDPWSEPKDLSRVLEADPILTLRVLHALNAGVYPLHLPVGDIRQALEILGLSKVLDVAITVALSDLFRGRGKYLAYDRVGLWQHMVAVGVCSRMLSTRLKRGGQANAYLAGLLHDVGIILLDLYRHAEFHQVLASLNNSRQLVVFERNLIPWDHTELGEAVGQRWRVPEFARAVIRWHHDPSSCPPPHDELAHCVAVANAVCSLKGLTSVGINLVRLPIRSLKRMGLTVGDVRMLADQLTPELERSRHLTRILDL